MKLHAHHQAVFDSGGKWFAVLGDRGGFGGHRSGEGMREIDARVGSDAGKKHSRLRESQRVPADVRHLQPLDASAQALTARLDRAQARAFRRFDAALVQPLHADADPEERLPRSDTAANCRVPVGGERARRREVADPRHDHGRGLGEVAGCTWREDIGAKVMKRLSHRREVSCTVINESDSHSLIPIPDPDP